MRNSNSLVVTLATVVGVGCLFAHAQDASAPSASVPPCDGKLTVRLSAAKTTFEVGHLVPVRVEMQNCGETDLWIALSYEENLGFPANLSLMIRDRHRRRVLPNGYLLLGGLGKPPYQWWIRLPPRYFYGREVTLAQYDSAFVNTPGKYQITASYTGIAPSQPLTKRPQEPTNVPPNGADVFRGHIESDPLEIEILPKAGP